MELVSGNESFAIPDRRNINKLEVSPRHQDDVPSKGRRASMIRDLKSRWCRSTEGAETLGILLRLYNDLSRSSRPPSAVACVR